MWSRTYGGIGDEWAKSLIATADGGYALAGGSLLMKTDASGNMQWNKSFAGGQMCIIHSLVAASDGGYAFTGCFEDFGTDYSAYWLVTTDANGVAELNRTYRGTWAAYAHSLVATSDGGYAIAGYKEPELLGPGYYSFWLIKTDALGNMQWNQTYGEGGMAFSLISTSDGGYAVAGCTWFGVSEEDFWLVKIDALGNMEWNKTYGGIWDDVVYSLVETSDGGYALAGVFNSNEYAFAPKSEFWLVKTDSFGNMEWNHTYGGAGDDVARSLVATSDGGYAIAGYTNSFGAGGNEIWLVKTDSFGNMEWNKTYGGTANEYAQSLLATPDGGYAIAGSTSSSGAGGSDIWLVKTDELGVYPEYSSWLVPALVLTATAVIIINKRRLFHKRSLKP